MLYRGRYYDASSNTTMYKNILRARVTDKENEVAWKDNMSFVVAKSSVWASRLRSPEEHECHDVVILRHSRCTQMYKFLITKYMSKTKHSNNQAVSVHCRFYWTKDQKSATLWSAQLPLGSAKEKGRDHLSSTAELPWSVCIPGYWFLCWCTQGKKNRKINRALSRNVIIFIIRYLHKIIVNTNWAREETEMGEA